MSHAGISERVFRFGDTDHLVGILTQPERSARVGDAPAAIFLNSGIIHRVGASRLHVQVARRLAADGFTSLRFDFSGIGDSEPRRDALRFEESAVREVQAAMDKLEEVTGRSRFTLAGLCSGADMAHEAGVVDSRVVALAQLDPYAYRTPKWFLRYYGPRAVRLGVWTNAVRVRWKEFLDRRRQDEGEEAASSMFVAPEYRRVFPPKAEVERGIATMADRGVHFFVCFTGHEKHFLYPEQYAESYGGVDFEDRLTVHYFPKADHTFTGLRWQRRIVREIGAWYQARFGGPQTLAEGQGPSSGVRTEVQRTETPASAG